MMRTATDVWEEIRFRCERALADGTAIPTLSRKVANHILSVDETSILRHSDEARTNPGEGTRVTRGMIEGIWNRLVETGASDGSHGLAFAFALVALIAGVEVSEGNQLYLADREAAFQPFDWSAEPRPRFWALGAKPSNYRLADAVRAKKTDLWRTGGADLRVGDRVAIYKFKGTEKHRGVLALGVVVEAPHMTQDPSNPHWTVEGRPLGLEATDRVRVRYVVPPRMPLWYEDSAAVRALAIARVQGGTCYAISMAEWSDLVLEAGGWVDDTASTGTGSKTTSKPNGQGWGHPTAINTVLDQHAMEIVLADLRNDHWDVKDVHQAMSFDIEARRPGLYRRVEVKGTTTSGASVLLTRNEKDLIEANPSEHALALVSYIELDDDARPSGGHLRYFCPFPLAVGVLRVETYRWTLPVVGGSTMLSTS